MANAYETLVDYFYSSPAASGLEPFSPAFNDAYNNFFGAEAARQGVGDFADIDLGRIGQAPVAATGPEFNAFDIASKTATDFFASFGVPVPSGTSQNTESMPIDLNNLGVPDALTPLGAGSGSVYDSQQGYNFPQPTSNPGYQTGAGTLGVGGDGLLRLISNAATGNNPPDMTPSGGTNISPWTYAPVTNTTVFDTSDNSSYSSNITNVTEVNSEGFVQNLLAGLKGFFGTPQAAASATPSNDAMFTRGAIYPGMFTVGQTPNTTWSTAETPNVKVGSIGGTSPNASPTPKVSDNRGLMLLGVAVGIISLLVVLSRRK